MYEVTACLIMITHHGFAKNEKDGKKSILFAKGYVLRSVSCSLRALVVAFLGLSAFVDYWPNKVSGPITARMSYDAWTRLDKK